MDEIAGGPSRQRRPRWLPWVATGVLVVAVGIGVWQVVGSSSSPSPSTSSAEASPSPPPSPVLGEPDLICQHGTSGVNPAPAHAPHAAGLTSDGWVGTLHPDVQQRGIYFQKAFLYATSQAKVWTRVTVESPSTARLYYVDATYWTGQQSQHPLAMFDPAAGQTAVSFQYCGQHPQGYFGGIMTQGPACVVLAARSQVAGAPEERVRVPVGERCG